MKEFVEKLIGRLEDLKASGNPYDSYWDEAMYRATELVNSTSNKTIDGVIEIVNQLTEEYKGGCCEWKKHRDYWESKCDYHIEENWFSEIFSVAPDEYHCPYCGKKIKVV